jgi:hypothetical protein
MFARTVISIVRVTEILEEETDIVVYSKLHPLHYINAALLDMIKALAPKVNQIHA